MNIKLFFGLLLLIGALVIFGSIVRPESEVAVVAGESTTSTISPTTTSQVALEPQTVSMGAVEVTVTPRQLKPGGEMVFEVAFNTHSVDLDYDFTQITTVTDDTGHNYQALEWTGEQGGHHLSGELIFEPLNDGLITGSLVELNIEGIDGVSDTLQFTLQ